MCVVSNVYDIGRTVPMDYWTPDKFLDFQKVVKMAERVDQEEGNPDCEDPSKGEWLKQVEERLDKLEKHVARIEYYLED